MTRDATRCIVCGARLVTEGEVVTCLACHEPPGTVLARNIVDVPPHRLRPGFAEVTHADGLALCGIVTIPAAGDAALTADGTPGILASPTEDAAEPGGADTPSRPLGATSMYLEEP